VAKAVAVIAIASFCAVLAREDSRAWGPPQSLCTLDNAQVNESSGLAASGLAAGVFFTHNDSGDTARFFRFDRKGSVDATYSLKGAIAVDWEDMARATVDGTSYLYLADVGDNAERRETVTIYRVEEPTTDGTQTIEKYQTYALKYPDRPHNCEALFVTSNGDMWVVTKNAGGVSKVFVQKKPAASGAYTFLHVADIEIDTGGFGGKLVTAADVSPDGKYVVLRTYSAALEFAAPAKFADWTKSKPTAIRLALEIQGEAITYSKDGLALVTTSEFAPCPVSLVALIRN